ncbi:hypothetical protein, partial [Pseudomonas syringae]|uniref:hypothetical protein n=1 Tax=Pseudomonas syringae TaxID=317 RepID=UPI001E381410
SYHMPIKTHIYIRLKTHPGGAIKRPATLPIARTKPMTFRTKRPGIKILIYLDRIMESCAKT